MGSQEITHTTLIMIIVVLRRFSKSPIRMTGRVISIVKGEPRGSSRFVMTLKKK